MRKVDSSKVWRGKCKPEKLEMKGFSVSLLDEASGKKRRAKVAGHQKISKATKSPSSRDTMTPRNHATMVSRYHDTIIELIRKAVKEFGKEAATHRFTLEEKKAISDIIYTYKGHGTRTSENEITRIAVNFIIKDYNENKEHSILDRALKALNK